MRKSFSPALGDSLSTARVFGIPLEEVRRSGQPGQEVPLLVKHIVEYIEEHGGLDLEGLFMVNGNAERVEWLRQRYDSGEEVDLEKEADLASAVSLLRLFLQELPEPVIPANLQAHILQLYQGYNNEEELAKNIKYFLQQLPQVNYSLLRFLCRFLSSVASLQEESWSIAGLAAVFGPDVFHLDTDVEDLKEQESVSRVLTELLESPEDYFDSEDDDVSTTNDYSSINEQITELLDDDKLEPCEELPPDGVESLPADEVRLSQVTPSSSSHISPISILPGSAEILQRTIRAAVQQHLLDLKSSIGQEISSYEGQGLSSQLCHGEEHPAEPATESAEGSGELVTLCATQVTPVGEHQDVQNPQSDCAALEESVGMDLDTRALVDAENNITTGRWDNCQVCEMIDGVNINTCEGCDLNANSELRECPGQPSSTATALDLRGIFIEREWEAPCPYIFPHIDFSCMHLQKEGEDPVPAFMSWQEDSESGEAQLSPLAGRMVPPPLGDNALQLQARHFLDFGHSQRFLHQDPDGVSPAKALPCGSHRPRRSSFSSKESMKGDAVSHQLTKKLQNLKKKIRQFEEQFEKDRNYKPSYGDKAANPKVFKWMTDLTKTRRQLKDAKQKVEAELAPQTRPRSNTLPKSFGSTLEQVAHDGGSDRRVTREETLELIQRRVRDKREEDRWPEDVRKMSKEQLSCEKMVLQRNLLHYEGLHGRPATREERLIVKPLYDRYRLVKQMLARASITPLTASPSSKRRSQTLQPIIEGETAHFCDEIKEEEEDEEDEEIGGELSELEVVIAPDPAAEPGSPQVRSDSLVRPKTEDKLALDLRLSSSNAASKPELLEQLWKARAEKKKLRKTIRDFEEDFYQQNGRNVQKEDRAPMIDEYKEYKRVKAKLRLLEVLISKQDSSKSI
ncbi:protein FAM13B isoform X2 [Paramormyrops kingsleyae]|uniref:protein FAM13B isoform X2 n=1 Tax=Paramormyrops kingsleyae TaxID=1676925 RepID=UPI000CD63C41|nr:protein FAM13B isoform X2 [Paramormyrops kingsleyae]